MHSARKHNGGSVKESGERGCGPRVVGQVAGRDFRSFKPESLNMPVADSQLIRRTGKHLGLRI